MRYYLVSFVDDNFKTLWRDGRRSLAKHQRQLNLRDLDELYFVYKYLGEDIPVDEINYLASGLESFVEGAAIRKFSHPLTTLKVGRKHGELSATEIAVTLKQTPELKQFFRIINDRVVGLSNEVVRRKDHNRLLGKIKLAVVRPNTSVREQAEINSKIKDLVFPVEILIDNISIVGLEVFNRKPRLQKYNVIKLP